MDYPFFQTFYDANGDLYMLGGAAFQRSTGQVHGIPWRGIPVMGSISGADPAIPPLIPSFGEGLEPSRSFNRQYLRAGGSGRNLILNTADGGPTEWARIPRVFYPGLVVDTWVHGTWKITKTGAATAELYDGTNIIAEMSTGTAPFGNFVATAQGETDYNGSSAFTISAIAETSVNYPQGTLAVSDGSYPVAGIFATFNGTTWTNDDDALSTIVVARDGSAELRYDGDVIATRQAGENPHSAGGEFVASTQGETDYNSAEPWTAIVTAPAIAPKVGWIYVMAHFTSGTLNALRGPYHSVAIPAATADLQAILIARSNGGGNVEQYHTGLILL